MNQDKAVEVPLQAVPGFIHPQSGIRDRLEERFLVLRSTKLTSEGDENEK